MATGLMDTNILVDVLRSYPLAINWLTGQRQLGVTRAVYLELLEGAENKREQHRALNLVKRFELVEMVEADFGWATRQLIKFGLSHSIDAFDCLIAAPAHRLQLPLHTRNLKHMTPLLGALAQEPY